MTNLNSTYRFKHKTKQYSSYNNILGIQPYNNYSKSYKLLRNMLNISKYTSKYYKYLINWGNKSNTNNYKYILNKHNNIVNSSNKLLTYKLLNDNNIRTCKYTTSIEEAKTFKFPVFCRKNFGHGGYGIHIAYNASELIQTDFYTEYIPKQTEYRVHVFRGKIISWSKKIPISESSNRYIFNHSNGYKFSKRLNSDCPPLISKLSIDAVKAVGLDFAGIDIIRSDDNHYFVLEVNTACGMDGSTIQEYANAIKEWVDENERNEGYVRR